MYVILDIFRYLYILCIVVMSLFNIQKIKLIYVIFHKFGSFVYQTNMYVVSIYFFLNIGHYIDSITLILCQYYFAVNLFQ